MQTSTFRFARRAALCALTLATFALPAWAQTAAASPAASASTSGPANTMAAPRVLFKTTLGEFIVEVYPDKAPKTVDNFLRYVNAKQYDGTIFHRVISNFMVQGGGYNAKFEEKITRPSIPLEAQNGLKHELGTIAMARTNEPNSARAQFFVNVKENAFLNATGPTNGYAVFGRVVSGIDTIHKIKAVPTGAGGPFPTDVPATTVLINSATLVK
jgi:peptidyl-prolyl cis-trans isomerase A (cyclophilin A)